MCKIMEDMLNENAELITIQTIRNLMETLKLSAEEVMAAMKIPDDDRARYQVKL